MNAANEVAVMAFLDGRVPLTRIGRWSPPVVDEHEAAPVVSLVSLDRADGWARRRAAELLPIRPHEGPDRRRRNH